MTDPGTPLTSNGDNTRFHSLASLKAANSYLLKRRRANEHKTDFLVEIESFVKRGQATGTVLNADAERWASQSLLDYWVNFLYRAGKKLPDATLADYDPESAPELSEADRPYIGLETFREPAQNLFFGRQKMVAEMIGQLTRHRWLSVIGPSGSGKSSLVLAGLLPKLKEGVRDTVLAESKTWHYLPPIVPGSDPLASLASLVEPANADTLAWTQHEVESLQQDHTHLLKLINETYREPVLIIVDQFEEIFTLSTEEATQQAFINNLIKVVEYDGARHMVVVTVRSDFEPYIAKLPELQALFESTSIRVTPLSPAELREAIERPAALVGLKFEEGIVEELVREVLGEPAGLPLLQFTLLKLWKDRTRNLVTWEAFHRLGSCRDALTRTADAYYFGLLPEDQSRVKRILLRLVRPGEGSEVFSNRMARTALHTKGEPREHYDRLLDELIDNGLLRETRHEKTGDTQIEVAHEALIRNWRTLVEWLDEERVNLRRRLRLTAAAKQWEALGRDSSALLRGAVLEEALRYDDLNKQEALFVRRSLNRRRFIKVLGVVAVLAVIGFLSILVYYYHEARDRALSRQLAAEAINNINNRLDLSLLLGLEAYQIEPTVEARRSLLQSVQASPNLISFLYGNRSTARALSFGADGKTLASANEDGTLTLWNVDKNGTEKKYQRLDSLLNKSDAHVTRVALSAERTWLATANREGNVTLWNTVTGQSSPINFEPEKRAASRPQSDASSVTKEVTSLAFSPDGQQLVSVFSYKDNVSAYNVVVLSNTATGESQTIPEENLKDNNGDIYNPNYVRSVAFSPDAKILAMGNQGGKIILWNVEKRQPFGNEIDTQRYRGQDEEKHGIRSLAFSPDGKILAAGGEDKSATLWDVSRPELASLKRDAPILNGHAGAVTALAFTRQEIDKENVLILASGGDDKLINLWRVSDISDKPSGPKELSNFQGRPIPLTRLTAHSFPVASLVFSPDGERLASSGEDKSVILWNTGARLQLVQTKTLPQRASFSIAASPDGKKFAIGHDGDGFITLIDSSNLNRLDEISVRPRSNATGESNGEQNPQSDNLLKTGNIVVGRLAFSPDGKRLASLASNAESSQINVLDLTTGRDWLSILLGLRVQDRPRFILSIPVEDGRSIAFSPDSQKLAVSKGDTSIVLLDVKTGQPLQSLTGSTGVVTSMAFSSDGRFLASESTDFSVVLWSLPEGKQINLPSGSVRQPPDSEFQDSLGKNLRQMTSVAFSPDNKILISTDWEKIIMWDVATHEPLGQPLVQHTRRITSLVFSPDGKTFASGGVDGIFLWDVETRQPIGQLFGNATGNRFSLNFGSPGIYLAFTNDGNRLASVGGRDDIYLWEVNQKAWMERACQSANRKLTDAEWQQYLGDMPYHPTCQAPLAEVLPSEHQSGNQ
jgi:WD40 repeat protein/energy-coupling factor transporter ATP-binding protein EcfA2